MSDGHFWHQGERAKVEAEVRTGRRVGGRSGNPHQPYAVGTVRCTRCDEDTDASQTIRTENGVICASCDFEDRIPAPPTGSLWFGTAGAGLLSIAGVGAVIFGSILADPIGSNGVNTIAFVALLLGAGAGVTAIAIGLPMWRRRHHEPDITGQSRTASLAMGSIGGVSAVVGLVAALIGAAGALYGLGLFS
ncbi:MAG: hypothetical protein AB8H79_22495 [Myxococcota bacterium]